MTKQELTKILGEEKEVNGKVLEKVLNNNGFESYYGKVWHGEEIEIVLGEFAGRDFSIAVPVYSEYDGIVEFIEDYIEDFNRDDQIFDTIHGIRRDFPALTIEYFLPMEDRVKEMDNIIKTLNNLVSFLTV